MILRPTARWLAKRANRRRSRCRRLSPRRAAANDHQRHDCGSTYGPLVHRRSVPARSSRPRSPHKPSSSPSSACAPAAKSSTPSTRPSSDPPASLLFRSGSRAAARNDGRSKVKNPFYSAGDAPEPGAGAAEPRLARRSRVWLALPACEATNARSWPPRCPVARSACEHPHNARGTTVCGSG
jgi:hypothetical protein